MPELLPWILLVHVLAAIVGLGPTFAFPLIGAMGGREPAHAYFATRISLAISERYPVPLVGVSGLTGLGMIGSARRTTIPGSPSAAPEPAATVTERAPFALFVQV